MENYAVSRLIYLYVIGTINEEYIIREILKDERIKELKKNYKSDNFYNNLVGLQNLELVQLFYTWKGQDFNNNLFAINCCLYKWKEGFTFVNIQNKITNYDFCMLSIVKNQWLDGLVLLLKFVELIRYDLLLMCHENNWVEGINCFNEFNINKVDFDTLEVNNATYHELVEKFEELKYNARDFFIKHKCMNALNFMIKYIQDSGSRSSYVIDNNNITNTISLMMPFIGKINNQYTLMLNDIVKYRWLDGFDTLKGHLNKDVADVVIKEKWHEGLVIIMETNIELFNYCLKNEEKIEGKVDNIKPYNSVKNRNGIILESPQVPVNCCPEDKTFECPTIEPVIIEKTDEPAIKPYISGSRRYMSLDLRRRYLPTSKEANTNLPFITPNMIERFCNKVPTFEKF